MICKYSATDPHLKIFSSRDHPPEAKFELQMSALKIHIQRFAHIFTTFSKIAFYKLKMGCNGKP